MAPAFHDILDGRAQREDPTEPLKDESSGPAPRIVIEGDVDARGREDRGGLLFD